MGNKREDELLEILKPKIVRYTVNGDVVLTNSQKEVLDKVFNWLDKEPKEHYKVVAGSAGTGKTFITTIIAKHSNKFLCLSAPTHKATSILRRNMSGYNVITLHKLLGIRPNMNLDDYDANDPKFASIGKMHIYDYQMVIVDEASMVNKSLFASLLTAAKSDNIKILFVGDPIQLPPPKEKSSIVFNNRDNIFELTELVRQKTGNPLINKLQVLRKDVMTSGSNFIRQIYSEKGVRNESGEGYYLFRNNNPDDKALFQNQIVKAAITMKADNNTMLNKYVAYTNDNISLWNRFIRHRVTDDNNQIININDSIMSYSTIVDEFLNPMIINSEDYIVIDITPYVNIQGFKGYLVKLATMYNDETPLLFILDHADEDTLIRFAEVVTRLRYDALRSKHDRSARWKDYYEFKDKILLLTDVIDEAGNVIVYKDLSYGHGITIHKSQGSTYNNVSVNVLDILYDAKGRPVRDINIRNRLLYVGLSRASNAAILLT